MALAAIFMTLLSARSVTARVLNTPVRLPTGEHAWASTQVSPLVGRTESTTCGGNSALVQCGLAFPSDFCCAAGTSCLSLNTSSSVAAAICCPKGSDCAAIQPFPCDLSMQNATQWPGSEYHSEPPSALGECGQGCCPLGYTCAGSTCHLIQSVAAIPAVSGSTTSASTTAAQATATVSTSATTTASAHASNSTALALADASKSSPGFSGGSFAAGLVPGILLGALLAAAVVFCLSRRMRGNAQPAPGEKPARRETDPSWHPTFHGRAISMPTANREDQAFRTDFLQATTHNHQATSSTSDSPPQPASRSPFLAHDGSHSPKPTQSPIPWHLKRGTLTMSVSPVRALRKQRSVRSLRRVMNASAASPGTSSKQFGNNGAVRVANTESGNAIMQAHDEHNDDAVSPIDRDSWASDDKDEKAPYSNPFSLTYPNGPPPWPSAAENVVPYTPSTYADTSPPMRVPARFDASDGFPPVPSATQPETRRNTTFSTLMERVGASRSAGVPQVPVMSAYPSSTKGRDSARKC